MPISAGMCSSAPRDPLARSVLYCHTKVSTIDRARVEVMFLEKKGHFEVVAVNVGDSRSFLVRPDSSTQSLTEDHTPNLVAEEARIRGAGGYTTFPF